MTDTHSNTRAERANNRLQAVLDAGARLFATRGFKASTMRDIAAEAGMLPGSLYYHFESKQDLLLEIYRRAVTDIQQRLDADVEAGDGPWERLEAGVIGHIDTILDENNYAKVMIGVVPADAPDIEAQLTALRDDYERSFTRLIDELPLDRATDRKLLRLMLLGAINATQRWYRSGAYTPADIGREFVRFLRQPLG